MARLKISFPEKTRERKEIRKPGKQVPTDRVSPDNGGDAIWSCPGTSVAEDRLDNGRDAAWS